MIDHGGRGNGGVTALLAALPEETRGILNSGQWRRVPARASLASYEGRVDGVEAFLAVSGVGRVRAEAAAREVLKNHHPISVISLGFAGGLHPRQRAGDLVVAQTLFPTHGLPNRDQVLCGEGPLTSDPALTDMARRILSELKLRHYTGACVTASGIVSSPVEKRRLGVVTGALAVDMESYWTGMVCQEFRVPFLSIRSIVDAMDRPLPHYLAQDAMCNRPESRWRQALPVLLRPRQIPSLLRLAVAASAARESLAEFVIGFMGARSRIITA